MIRKRANWLAGVMRSFIALIAGFGLVCGLMVATAAPASADEPVTTPSVSSSQEEEPAVSAEESASDSSSDQEVDATEAEGDLIREETIGEPIFGAASFDLEGQATATARVKTRDGTKILLNVKVKPIKVPARRCWKVPVGTRVMMTGLWEGQLAAAPYTVKAGDNTFCHFHGDVVKESCGNPAYGVPGGPKHPPRNMPRIRGKVQFADFHRYTVRQKVKEELSGSASAEVNVYDGDRRVCHASGRVTGHALAFSRTAVVLRSRSRVSALAKGGRELEIKVSQMHKASIKAKNMVKVSISGQVDVMCEYTPPPPDDQAPSVSASAIGCVGPDSPTADVVVSFASTNEDDVSMTVRFNGQTRTVTLAADGTGSTIFQVSAPGSYSGTVTANPSGKSAPFSVTVNQCDTPPPTGNVICKNPPHIYAPGGNGIMICELSRSDGVKPTLSVFGLEALNGHAYFAQPTEYGWRDEAQLNPCPANVLCVRVQVWAVSPGLFQYRFRYGQQPWVTGQFMIEEDDF